MATTGNYALGYTHSEQDRLIRQAARIERYTERLFRDAGVGPGQRVLDLGSGVGDVSMLLSRIVGPSGEVVGIERDATSIARARERVAEAGIHNVRFIQTDANQIVSDQLFDAAVGRFILMFLPDPASVLHSLSNLVRPGGILAFQEPSWVPFLAFSKGLPLWSSVLRVIHETLQRSGANPEMGPGLYRMLQNVGLPAPAMHMEIVLGSDEEFTRLVTDLAGSLRPLSHAHGVELGALGEFDTLSARVHAEVVASNSMVSFVPMVGAWTRKPTGV